MPAIMEVVTLAIPKVLLLFVVLFSPNLAFAERCKLKNELTAADLTPYKMKKIFSTSQVETIGDFVCCLPKEFRNDMKVINHSQSAQPGLRIIFGDFAKYNMMLSISGEPTGLWPGLDTIEIMTTDKKLDSNKKTFEASFNQSGQFHMETNPQKCLACHAGSVAPSKAQSSELRVVFEDDPWARANSGLTTMDDLPEICKPIDRYLKEVGNHKRLEAAKQEKFKCIDNKKLLASRITADEDASIAKHDHGRKNRILEQSNFERFRFLMYGLNNGCFEAGKTTGFVRLNEWLSKEYLRKQQSYAYSHPLARNTLRDVFSYRDTMLRKDRAHILSAGRKIDAIPEGDLATTDKLNSLNLDKTAKYCATQTRLDARDTDGNVFFDKPEYSRGLDAWLNSEPPLFQNHFKTVLSDYTELSGVRSVFKKALENYMLDLAGISVHDLSELMDRSEFRRSVNLDVSYSLQTSQLGVPAEIVSAMEPGDIPGPRKLSKKHCEELSELSKNELSRANAGSRGVLRTKEVDH